MGPKSNKIVPLRDGEEHTQTQREGDRSKMEAETAVMQPLAKGCQEPPEARRGQEEFLPQASGAGRGEWSLWPQKWERIRVCCAKPPSLWSFVTAAPGGLTNAGSRTKSGAVCWVVGGLGLDSTCRRAQVPSQSHTHGL